MESAHQRKASEGTEIVNNVETRQRDADRQIKENRGAMEECTKGEKGSEWRGQDMTRRRERVGRRK
jgi:hypothetical protein